MENKNLRSSDILTGIILAALGVFIIIYSINLSRGEIFYTSAGFLPLIPRPPTHFPFPSKRGMPPSSVVKAGSQKSAIVIRSLNSLSWKSFVELPMRKAV